MSVIPHNLPALEATRDWAFKAGYSLAAEDVRWIVEVFLEEYDARIDRNRLGPNTVETRITSHWKPHPE